MIKKVDPQVDFIKLEHSVLDFWEKNDIFNKRVTLNKGKPPWSFIDGPITANNPMGVHHAWGRTIKDMMNRYKAMKGFDLRYQNGFDCQGLWVEVEVEKELGFKSKRDVEEYGIEKFVNLCKERVRKYSAIQTEQSKRLGYWMDWDNSYYTMSDENNYTIWSMLKKLFEDGKIYRGMDVVPWSGKSGTSYSQMEIIEGRKLVAHESVFVRFPILDRENEYLLVWTTTPWTLTSNVIASVNVNLEYVKLRAADGSLYYFAKENLEFQRLEKQFSDKKQWIEGVPKLKTISQIFKERGGYEIEGTVKGSDLVGIKYSGPFDDLEAQTELGGYPFTDEKLKSKGINGVNTHQVIDAGKDSIGNDIVVAGEGTGIVHMAPGCGDIDYKIGKKMGFINIAPLDAEAKFMEKFGWLSGLVATEKDTINKIITDLKERGFLVYSEQYPHVYPHCWRSGDELVFRMVDEWYINMDWRNRIKNVVDQINWIPDWGKDREHEWLDNMGDWMISKKRFWGLALPIWEFEDGSFMVIGSKEELKGLAIEGWDEFDGESPHRPWIDKVKIKHPETGLIGTRILDVGNPWLDAGIVPYSTLNYNDDKKYWEKWFPGDFVVESFPGQFRNWFYSLLALSTVMEDKAPFKTLLGHALVKDETGRDMHKSWGNAIWFDDAAEEIGVDVMRWMYANQNIENNLLFGYGPANEVRRKLLTLWNVYSFFATYAAVDKFSPLEVNIKDSHLTLLDHWILAKSNLLVKEAVNAFDSYRVDKFIQKFERFLDDLSNWYIRRNRRRFWKSENDTDKEAAYHTLYHVLLNSVKIIAPILPFMSEKIYQNLVCNIDKNLPESVHLCEYPEIDDQKIDQKMIDQVDAIRKMVELGRSARNKSELKIRQPLQELCFHLSDNSIKEFVIENQNIILEELNVKNIKYVDSTDKLIGYIIKPNLPFIGQDYGKELPKIKDAISKMDSDKIVSDINQNGEVAIHLESKTINLKRDAFLIDKESKEGYTSESDGNITVGLTTELSEKLVQEGIARDVIRHVQIMRKNANFAVEDRINIYGSFDGEIGDAIKANEDYFKNETLTVNMIDEFQSGEYEESFEIKGTRIKISINRI
ncbi:MAG: isoleucine--tRNA ligase [Candidatus Neomarinimicrobiota bacterium]|nr:isoleucine--tRNA ligase [Candidatus Neomarinimicrobiota bacterium]